MIRARDKSGTRCEDARPLQRVSRFVPVEILEMQQLVEQSFPEPPVAQNFAVNPARANESLTKNARFLNREFNHASQENSLHH